MRKNKVISGIVVMFTFLFFAKAEEVNFHGNYEGIKMEKNIEISTQAIKPEFEQKVRILERKTLSDLVSKCSDENKIKFYKSLICKWKISIN
jgi:DNA polymerase III sliding clamp (beta) subunit (PCNA family)